MKASNGTTSGPDTPVSGTPGQGATSPLPPPSAPSGSADLTVVVDDGTGATQRWHLTCDPAGGDHPDPSTACGVLGANGATALPPVPGDTACTEIYGGPQKATVIGTWRGESVRASFSRSNGCEIARWEAMRGLLPNPEA